HAASSSCTIDRVLRVETPVLRRRHGSGSAAEDSRHYSIRGRHSSKLLLLACDSLLQRVASRCERTRAPPSSLAAFACSAKSRARDTFECPQFRFAAFCK